MRRYILPIIIILISISLIGSSCSEAPAPALAPTPTPAPEVTTAPSTTPEPEQTKEKYYSTIEEKYYEIRDGEPDEPVIVIEEKREFETDEEYNARRSEKLEKLEEWETTVFMKYYRDSEENFLVVLDGVSIPQYDMSGGFYDIFYQEPPGIYTSIDYPQGIEVSVVATSWRYNNPSNAYNFHFYVKVPVEKAKKIREQEERGELSITMTVHFDFPDKLEHHLYMAYKDAKIYIPKVTLNNKDGEQLYQWSIPDYQHPQTVEASAREATEQIIASALWRHELSLETTVPLIATDDRVYLISGRFLQALDTKTGEMLWQHESPDDIQLPFLFESTIVFHLEDVILALDAITGEVIWDVKAKNIISSVVYKGVVYFGYESFTIASVDLATGEKLLDKDVSAHSFINQAPFVINNVLLVSVRLPQNEGAIHALDAITGEELWEKRYKMDRTVSGKLVVSDGTILAFTSSSPARRIYSSLHAIDITNGNNLWRTSFGYYGSQITSDGESIYFSEGDSDIYYRLDIETGGVLWEYQSTGDVSRPALVNGVIIGDSGDDIIGLDAQSGTLRWRYIPDAEVTTAVTVAHDVIYVGVGDYVRLLEAATGEVIEEFKVTDTVSRPPVVLGDVVYVVSEDKYLYAFRIPPR